MDDEGRKAMKELVQSQAEFDKKEGQRLMAGWMKKKLNALAMHPHQRNSAVHLTLNLFQKKELN